MEQRLSKQESKNMDSCLRRLKQELVGSVVSTSVIALDHWGVCFVLFFYFIHVYF